MEAICDRTNVLTPDVATEQLLHELKGSPTDLAKLVMRIAPRRRRIVVPLSALLSPAETKTVRIHGIVCARGSPRGA